jgi:hypothetical protein
MLENITPNTVFVTHPDKHGCIFPGAHKRRNRKRHGTSSEDRRQDAKNADLGEPRGNALAKQPEIGETKNGSMPASHAKRRRIKRIPAFAAKLIPCHGLATR